MVALAHNTAMKHHALPPLMKLDSVLQYVEDGSIFTNGNYTVSRSLTCITRDELKALLPVKVKGSDEIFVETEDVKAVIAKVFRRINGSKSIFRTMECHVTTFMLCEPEETDNAHTIRREAFLSITDINASTVVHFLEALKLALSNNRLTEDDADWILYELKRDGSRKGFGVTGLWGYILNMETLKS